MTVPGPLRDRDRERGRDAERLTLSVAMRVATGIVGLALLLLGAGGMLTSRLSGDVPATLPFVAVMVAAFGVTLLVVAVRGRSFAWLPVRQPPLLPQLVLAVGVVTLVAIGHGVSTVRRDAPWRYVGTASMVLAVAIVVLAVVRRWVPRIGDQAERR